MCLRQAEAEPNRSTLMTCVPLQTGKLSSGLGIIIIIIIMNPPAVRSRGLQVI